MFHLSTAGCFDEGVNERRHIEGVDIVANLLALVAKYVVLEIAEIALHEVTQKSVQNDASVVRTGETPATQTTRRHPKIPAVLLDHDVRRNL